MALKQKEIIIESGRDKGKKFLITEMPAYKIDDWAMRVLLALAGAGIDVAEAQDGLMGLARVAFQALGKIPSEVSLPLLNELLDCVQIIPNGTTIPRPLDLDLNDIEDFQNLWRFRKEVFSLHADFLLHGDGLS